MPLAFRRPSVPASPNPDAPMRQGDATAVCPPSGVVAPTLQTPLERITTSCGVLCLLLTVALYGCGGSSGSSNASSQTPTQTPTTQEPTAGPTPPPPTPATQLFLGGDTAADGCGPLPANARGSLCASPSSPIRATVTLRHFIFDGFPGEWRGTLAEPLTGMGYKAVVQLAMAPRMTATGVVEILLRQGAIDTVLFRSNELVVDSDMYKEFMVGADGVAAAGAAGDLLVFRISCVRGCQTQGLGVLLVRDRPVFIEVPHTSLR